MSEIRIARTAEEVSAWTGAALVIDVIRFSTTVCALAESGRKVVRIHPTSEALKADAAGFAEADLFSELDLGPDFPIHDPLEGPVPRRGIVRFDNSPWAARDPSRADRPALVATGSGARAASGCPKASRILVGGFCNFTKMLAALRGAGSVLLVPAASFPDRPAKFGQAIEDGICAEAFRAALENPQASRPEHFLQRILDSGRPGQFREFRPADDGRDLDLCLGLDTIRVLPRIRLEDGVGTLQ